ncbi:MAG: hypothetical protein V4502_04975 [Pseudomonadota bacterium]
MRAVLRASVILATAGLAAWPSLALAQDTNQVTATTNAPAPATNSIGPRDLQNFNLQGTVTRPADQPARTAPAATAPRPRAEIARTQETPTPTRATQRPATRPTAETQAPPRAAGPGQTPSASRVTVPLPTRADNGSTSNGTVRPDPGFTPTPDLTVPAQPQPKLPLWPWLLAAAALGAAGAFLFLRNRSRQAFAGGPEIDSYVAPEPAPTPPQPAPTPPQPASPPPIAGLVSTRLRPWIEVGFQPLQCTVDDDKVTVDFELELFNSGSGPARAVLAEASLFNAGSDQDQVIGAFFANPVGAGERIVAIQPLKRVTVRHQLVVERSQVRAYALAGHTVFVPVLAFNALYRWGGGAGQTSVAYLLGRDTKSDKLGPFRLDLGARSFRAISGRPLPLGVRT